MSDEKKRDDSYTVDMGNGNEKRGPSPQPQMHKMPAASQPVNPVGNSPILPIVSYCGSSILMTVTNKYVLSGMDFNLNFFLLCVQVCPLFLLPQDSSTDTSAVNRLRRRHPDLQTSRRH